MSKLISVLGSISAGKMLAIFSNGAISIFMMKAKGNFSIKNLSKASNFPVYSPNNRFIKKAEWYVGLSVTDKSSVEIDNIKISSVYGEGIYIATTKQEGDLPSSRFTNAVIKNCKVYNCWGYNPKTDDYDNGIYISNVVVALVENNSILNDFNHTKQLGRSGIVLEYMTQNCTLKNNTIFGYDCAIHIEADYGGHIITQNLLSVTDLAIANIQCSL